MLLDPFFNVICAIFKAIGLPLIVLMAVTLLWDRPLRVSSLISTIMSAIKFALILFWRIADTLSQFFLGRLIPNRTLSRLARLALQTISFCFVVAIVVCLLRP